MVYEGVVLYSVTGGYLVLRLIATATGVPIYARAGGPFENVEAAISYGDQVAADEDHHAQ